MAFVVYLTAILVILSGYLLKQILPVILRIRRSRKALIGQFPTPDYHPIIGHFNTFPGPNEAGLQWFYDMTKKYPRYFVFVIGPMAKLHLNHPDVIKQLAKTTQPKPVRFGGGYRTMLPWIGDGLLLSNGDKWFRNRKLLTHGFHFDVLKPYVQIYNEAVRKLMQKFQCESASCDKGMDVYKPVSHCALDIILRCAFSSEQDVQREGAGTEYAQVVMKLGHQVLKRLLNPFVQLDFVYYLTNEGKDFAKNCQLSHKVADDVIRKRKLELQKSDTVEKLSHKRNVDFLDILLLAKDDQGHGLTDREIRDEVETFMFEGHDTTASGTAWALYNLAKHPEYQAKARAEVDSVLNDGRDDDVIVWEDLSKLPYLTQCIKESMRLHTTVPFIGRELATPLELDGKMIPAGTLVDMNLFNLHHNPEMWKDPMTYDPDRFLPERMADMDSYAFMPFSAGPRNCIGQNFAMNEMKTTLALILRRFEMTLDPKKESLQSADVVMRSKDGIHLKFTKRQLTSTADLNE